MAAKPTSIKVCLANCYAISPVIGQLKWAGSALGQRIRALLSSAAGGAHASFGPHAYVLAFGNGLEGFAVDKQKVTVQGSDPPSEQRGCSNLAAMAAYRFREVTQHVTLLPLAGLGDRE